MPVAQIHQTAGFTPKREPRRVLPEMYHSMQDGVLRMQLRAAPLINNGSKPSRSEG
jgi:hypothetical protein